MKEHFDLFNTTDQVVVHNPTSDDFRFMVGGEREYEVKAGQFKLLHGSAARLYVKKMLDIDFIAKNRVTDLNNKNAEIEAAKKFIKKVIDDDTELNPEALADLLKKTVDSDVPEPKEEPTKSKVQEELAEEASDQDSAPVKEAEFPDIKQEPAKVAKK